MKRHTVLAVAGMLVAGIALFGGEARARGGFGHRGPYVRSCRPGWHPRPHVAYRRPCYPTWSWRPMVCYAPRPVAYHPAGALFRVLQRFSAACTPVYQPRPYVATYATYTSPTVNPRYAGAVAMSSPQPLVWSTPTQSTTQTMSEPAPRHVVCAACKGTGRTACTRCRGTGRVTILGDWGPIARACPTCGGTGRSAHVCPHCAGAGRVLSR